jgi:hypothetical protein
MKRSMILSIMIVMLLALAVMPALAAPVPMVDAAPQTGLPAEVCAYAIWYRPTCDRHYADFTR